MGEEKRVICEDCGEVLFYTKDRQVRGFPEIQHDEHGDFIECRKCPTRSRIFDTGRQEGAPTFILSRDEKQ